MDTISDLICISLIFFLILFQHHIFPVFHYQLKENMHVYCWVQPVLICCGAGEWHEMKRKEEKTETNDENTFLCWVICLPASAAAAEARAAQLLEYGWLAPLNGINTHRLEMTETRSWCGALTIARQDKWRGRVGRTLRTIHSSWDK